MLSLDTIASVNNFNCKLSSTLSLCLLILKKIKRIFYEWLYDVICVELEKG